MKRDFDKPHQDNPILKLTFEFSLKIIELAECLEESKKYVVARQIKSQVHLLAQIFTKLKMLKASLILYINSKLQLKKQMKLNTGLCYARTAKITQIRMS